MARTNAPYSAASGEHTRRRPRRPRAARRPRRHRRRGREEHPQPAGGRAADEIVERVPARGLIGGGVGREEAARAAAGRSARCPSSGRRRGPRRRRARPRRRARAPARAGRTGASGARPRRATPGCWMPAPRARGGGREPPARRRPGGRHGRRGVARGVPCGHLGQATAPYRSATLPQFTTFHHASM